MVECTSTRRRRRAPTGLRAFRTPRCDLAGAARDAVVGFGVIAPDAQRVEVAGVR